MTAVARRGRGTSVHPCEVAAAGGKAGAAAEGGDPLWSLQYNTWASVLGAAGANPAKMRAPVGMSAPGGTDGSIIVIDENLQYGYELWQFRSKGGNRDGYPVYARNGAAFVVNPYVSDSALANATETHRRIAEELKKRQALAPYEKQSDPFKVVRFGL